MYEQLITLGDVRNMINNFNKPVLEQIVGYSSNSGLYNLHYFEGKQKKIFYVGRSVDISARLSGHRSDIRNRKAYKGEFGYALEEADKQWYMEVQKPRFKDTKTGEDVPERVWELHYMVEVLAEGHVLTNRKKGDEYEYDDGTTVEMDDGLLQRLKFKSPTEMMNILKLEEEYKNSDRYIKSRYTEQKLAAELLAIQNKTMERQLDSARAELLATLKQVREQEELLHNTTHKINVLAQNHQILNDPTIQQLLCRRLVNLQDLDEEIATREQKKANLTKEIQDLTHKHSSYIDQLNRTRSRVSAEEDELKARINLKHLELARITQEINNKGLDQTRIKHIKTQLKQKFNELQLHPAGYQRWCDNVLLLQQNHRDYTIGPCWVKGTTIGFIKDKSIRISKLEFSELYFTSDQLIEIAKMYNF